MRFARERLERDGFVKRFECFWSAAQTREDLAERRIDAGVGRRKAQRTAKFRFRFRETVFRSNRQSQIEMRFGALQVAFHRLAEELFCFQVVSLLARLQGRLVLSLRRSATRFQGQ